MENICVVCYAPFMFAKNNHNKRYCSDKCRGRDYYLNHKKEYRLIEKNQYLKHKKEKLVRLKTNYHRKKILDFYNNKCSECGTINKLELHHKQYIWHIRDLRKNIKNIIVLCTTCHNKKHSK